MPYFKLPNESLFVLQLHIIVYVVLSQLLQHVCLRQVLVQDAISVSVGRLLHDLLQLIVLHLAVPIYVEVVLEMLLDAPLPLQTLFYAIKQKSLLGNLLVGTDLGNLTHHLLKLVGNRLDALLIIPLTICGIECSSIIVFLLLECLLFNQGRCSDGWYCSTFLVGRYIIDKARDRREICNIG